MSDRSIQIRDETAQDARIIRQVTEAAFKDREYSSGTEGAIIDSLRSAGALTISLVAMTDNQIAGHVAFSPVTIDGSDVGWYGLGPVAVRPDTQQSGVGKALIRAGLDRLKRMRARGCVVLGDRDYYSRFGFENRDDVRFPGPPAKDFMILPFDGIVVAGEVRYHEAFSTTK